MDDVLAPEHLRGGAPTIASVWSEVCGRDMSDSTL